jgi:hypothetical protein
MHLKKPLGFVLCFVLVTAVLPARAQQIVPPGAIDQALTEKAADLAAKQQTIRTALQQPEVQRVAKSLGVDIARAQGAVGTFSGADLDRVAAQAQLVNDEVSGGQTVRLNLLWVIIGLLILILIIVAA